VLIERMRNAKDLMYLEALQRYDAHLIVHPKDIRIQLERCAFIGNALYDEYDEYNPNEEAFDSCLTALGDAYPDEPTVVLARAAELWSDSKVDLLLEAEARMKGSGIEWTDGQRAELHRELASTLHYDERSEEALDHIEQAVRYQELDRSSLLHAEILLELGRDDEALEVLNLRTDTSEGAWMLQRRAELLLRSKDHVNALRVYREVELLDSSALDLGDLARTLEGAGEFAAARSYLVRDTMRSWATERRALALFEHDLLHQPSDTCLASYNALREHGYLQDPFALNRLRLFIRSPLRPWQPRDMIGVLALLALAVLLVMLPYTWVLPVHFIGTRWPRLKGKVFGAMHWGLKDFWWVSAGYFVASVAAVMSCPSCVRAYFVDEWDDTLLEGTIDARMMLVFVSVWAIWTVPMLWRKWPAVFRSPYWSTLRSMGQGLLYLLVFRFLGGIYLKSAARIFDVDLTERIGWLLTPLAVTQAEMLAFMNAYGVGATFLATAFVVPVYEEVIFRGVILNSVTRYIGFGRANILQALVFSAVHGDLFLAPYFFGFGVFTGLLVRRSESLTSGVVFHVANNLLVVVVLTAAR
jgi:membrane protease YdiL (CAAX protease family)/tetratricopeptide (TPR) repeat protein